MRFRQRKGRLENEPVISIFVKHGLKRRPIHKVRRNHRIPRRVHVRIGGRVRVIPVDLVPSSLGRLNRGSRPEVPAGEAVGNQHSPSNLGTLGWVARLNGADRDPVVCGACHVLLRLRGSRFVGDRDRTFVFAPDDPEFIAIPPFDPDEATTGFVILGRRVGRSTPRWRCWTREFRRAISRAWDGWVRFGH